MAIPDTACDTNQLVPEPIAPLREADISDAMRLSAQAGWNQIEADWRRLLVLWPENCLAIRDAGHVIATGSLATFDSTLGWIGMILVDESHRKRGLGGAMMDFLLRQADRIGLARVGLDATELGRLVYSRRGFAEHSLINRWSGSTKGAKSRSTRRVRSEDWSPIVEMDRSAFGHDRTALLRHLACETGAFVRVIETGNNIIGFGMSRRGRTAGHIGPIVADHLDAASQLLDALLADLAKADQGAAVIDVPDACPLAQHLQSKGFSASRRLTRMFRPTQAPAQTNAKPRVFAAAGFELG